MPQGVSRTLSTLDDSPPAGSVSSCRPPSALWARAPTTRASSLLFECPSPHETPQHRTVCRSTGSGVSSVPHTDHFKRDAGSRLNDPFCLLYGHSTSDPSFISYAFGIYRKFSSLASPSPQIFVSPRSIEPASAADEIAALLTYRTSIHFTRMLRAVCASKWFPAVAAADGNYQSLRRRVYLTGRTCRTARSDMVLRRT